MKWKRSKKAKEQQQMDNSNSGEKDKPVRSDGIKSSVTYAKDSQAKEISTELTVTSEKIEKVKTERFIVSESCKLMARPLDACATTVIGRQMREPIDTNSTSDGYAMSMDEGDEEDEEELEERVNENEK